MTTTQYAGVSDAAKTLMCVQDELVNRREETVTLSSQLLADQLIDVFEQCSLPNWDGDGATPVEVEALAVAKELVESLPSAYQVPTVSGEPDGHVSLEWYANQRRLLSLSIAPHGRVYWAALIGSEDPRGSFQFHGAVPEILLLLMRRVCKQ
ncbi:MAG: hypothetical protein KDA88_11055 [Planctomycetaceae bacterium]|nr:hypothetical protein [Planctomycetaceae bacterium]MCB9951109.1 hypothetical protein [Planctomycetaceae bacterium]